MGKPRKQRDLEDYAAVHAKVSRLLSQTQMSPMGIKALMEETPNRAGVRSPKNRYKRVTTEQDYE